jgi:hypothetical protein
MSRRFFNLASLVLQYILPFTVITYSYTKVWIILSNRTRPGNTKEKEKLDLRRKKRTNRMLISMVVIFAFCWLPLNIVYLIMEFEPSFDKWPYFYTVFFISHSIAMSSTIYNPFLYAWLNDNFRKEFRLILPCFFKAIDYCRRRKGLPVVSGGSGGVGAAATGHAVGNNEVIELDDEERFERTRLMTGMTGVSSMNSGGAAVDETSRFSTGGKKEHESTGGGVTYQPIKLVVGDKKGEDEDDQRKQDTTI